MPNKIDEATLFSALQSELNARVSARAAINTSHIQTIIFFVGGYVIVKNTTSASPWLPYMFSTIIPIISYYFVSLYRHNDLQIGLLNRSLRKLEQNSSVQDDLRFFQVGSFSGSQSYEARSISHFAVMMLCLASPLLIFIDSLFSFIFVPGGIVSLSGPQVFVVSITSIISFINVYSLVRLDKRRQEFINS